MMKKALQFVIGLFIISNGAFAQWSGSTSPTGNIFRSGNVGINNSNPAYPIDVTGEIHSTGDVIAGGVNVTAGDIYLSRLTDPYGYIIRPNNTIYKNLAFAVTGGGNLDNLKVNANLSTFNGQVSIGAANGIRPLIVATDGPSAALFQHNSSGNSYISVANTVGTMNIGVGSLTPHPYIWSSTNTFFIGNDGSPTVFVNGMNNGSVGIGTTNPGTFKLAVEGKIGARGIKVTVENPFPDYVFEPTYQLRSLAHLEQYINQNKHLPGIPSAEEVKKEGGIELGDMNVKLLEKIEELTLYVIEIKKENEQMKKEIKEMKEKK